MRIRLPADQMQVLRDVLHQAGSKEIGGQIYGEQIAPSNFVITELTVQKRAGTFSRFVVDLIQVARDAARFFDRTQHQYDRYNYVGEWHSHPNFEIYPSDVDMETMFRLVTDKDFKGRFAILMIARLYGEELAYGTWLIESSGRSFAINMEQL